MRVVWRRVSPDGFNHELVWLAISVGTIVAGAIWLTFGLPWPRCPFLAVTGFPCMTCGATRCATAFLHGNFLAALRWNPLGFAALCGVAAFDLYAIVVLAGRGPRLRMVDWTAAEKNVARIAVVALTALNWVYLLSHRALF